LRYGGRPAGLVRSTDTPFSGRVIFSGGLESGDATAWSIEMN